MIYVKFVSCLNLSAQCSDIDLVVQSDYMSRRDRVAILKSLATVIRRAGIAEHVTVIAKAKVPIIKFVTIHGLFRSI